MTLSSARSKSLRSFGLIACGILSTTLACQVQNPIEQTAKAQPSIPAAQTEKPNAQQLRNGLMKNFEKQVADAGRIKAAQNQDKSGITQQLDRKQLVKDLQKLPPGEIKLVRPTDAPAAPTDAQEELPTATTPLKGLGKSLKIKPDKADTASKPPTAKDLKRYTKDLPGKGKLRASIRTTRGDFHCELFEDVAPMTVANFVGLGRGLKAYIDPVTKEAIVGQPFFQDVAFHRVIPGFMIQTGDRLSVGMDKPNFKMAPTGPAGTGNPGYRFADETSPKLKHDKPAILSMANSGPGTNGSQFFITEVPTPHLDGRHTVFGQCDNLDLVRGIAQKGNGKTSIITMTFYRE